MKRASQGIGLLELCMVLAVIAILMLMALREYRVVQSAHALQRFKAQLAVLVNAGQQWQSAHGDFQWLTLEGLRDEGLLPASWRLNLWGGETHIGPAPGRSPQHWQLMLTQVPMAQCVVWRHVDWPWQVTSECIPATSADSATAIWRAVF